MILILHHVKPCEDILLKLLYALVGWSILHVKYRRQIAIAKTHLVKEEVSLCLSRRAVAPEMISPTDIAILTGLSKIVLKVAVEP